MSKASQALAFPQLVGLLALIAWCGLTLASGGVDFGSPTAGDPAAEWTVAISLGAGAVIASVLAWRLRAAPVWRSLPFALAGGGAAGLAGWAALSIRWSGAPHLAWIEANQLTLAFIALFVAAALATGTQRAGSLLVTGLAIAGAPATFMALAGESLPTRLGADLEPGRLSGPLDSPNALATVIAISLPGVVWIAGSGSGRWRLPLAGAWIALLVTTLALTLSRSGVAAAVLAVAVIFIAIPFRARAVAALVAGLVGAIAPVVYGLSTDVLTQDRIEAVARRDEGLVLGTLIIAGALVGALIAVAGEALLRRGRSGVVMALFIAAMLALPAVALATTAPDQAPEARDAITNEPDRVLSLSSNNRLDWWGEALDGWRAHPVIGNGAGSFSQVHLRYRSDGDPRFNVRQPHQIALKALSDLGVVGLALLVAIALGALLAAIRIAKSSAPRRWALPAAIITAFLVEAQLDVSLSVPALALPAFAAVGVVIADAAPRIGEAGSHQKLEPVLAAAAAMLAILLIASALLPALSADRVRAGERALLDGDTEETLARSEDARNLNPLAIAPLELAASAHRERGDFGAMITSLRTATEIQPDNPRSWSRLALLLDRLGGTDEAREAWRRVRELDPKNRRALEALAQPVG